MFANVLLYLSVIFLFFFNFYCFITFYSCSNKRCLQTYCNVCYICVLFFFSPYTFKSCSNEGSSRTYLNSCHICVVVFGDFLVSTHSTAALMRGVRERLAETVNPFPCPQLLTLDDLDSDWK